MIQVNLEEKDDQDSVEDMNDILKAMAHDAENDDLEIQKDLKDMKGMKAMKGMKRRAMRKKKAAAPEEAPMKAMRRK